jgi:hypothetical protein
MLNAADTDKIFTLPPAAQGKKWRRKVDTAADPDILEMGHSEVLDNQKMYPVLAHSLVLLLSNGR